MNTYISSVSDRQVSAQGVNSVKHNSSHSFADNLKEFSDKKAFTEGSAQPDTSVMLVGEISSSNQTVSELLMQHDTLKEETWNILAAKSNQNNDYTKLPAGTKIFYDSSDGSLRWDGASSQTPFSVTPATPPFLVTTAPVNLGEVTATPSPSSERVELGVIDAKNPTVSHLLKAHPELGRDTWNILSSAENSDKDFTALAKGTVVHIDAGTREVSWGAASEVIETPVQFAESVQKTSGLPVSTVVVNEEVSALGKADVQSDPISLGILDSKNPTVSHLLQQHPEQSGNIWSLLASEVNRDKPFQAITPGTEIFLQPGSQEIVWSNATVRHEAPAPVTAVAQEQVIPHQRAVNEYRAAIQDGQVNDLTEAVQPFMGKSYKEIDCYELLVKGLERMDIPYTGKDGLLRKLTSMAHEKGLPANAFMNGEGIVKAAGSLVLSKNYPRTSNWKRQAEQLYNEMTPLLDKGQILSFSTRKRGHTGIVSQQQDQWTFINSGRLDNALTSGNPSRGVGEEVLQREIRNWFKLANKSGEPLTVTLGAIGSKGVVTALNAPQSIESTKHI